MPGTETVVRDIGRELSGLDQLETPIEPRKPLAARAWSATWPKLAALVIAIFVWQVVVWTHWRPTYAFPAPGEVFSELWAKIADGTLLEAAATTLRRAGTGYALALLVGTVIGAAVSSSKVLRTAFASLITGLQTMPSIAWFPLAILLYGLSESAMLFVVVIGAAPSIANGLLAGVDLIPPLQLRAARVLGARGLSLWRHVVLPAALPSYLGGLKQGWAFAWRSLMAGELLVVIANKPSIGVELQVAREFSNAAALMATMIVILAIGIIVDSLLFGTAERAIRRRWGLAETS